MEHWKLVASVAATFVNSMQGSIMLKATCITEWRFKAYFRTRAQTPTPVFTGLLASPQASQIRPF
jgi:hypothetical protein